MSWPEEKRKSTPAPCCCRRAIAASSDLRSLIAVDFVQVSRNGLQASGLDRRRVHATGIEIADFLFVGTRGSSGFGGGIQDGAQSREVIVAQLRERAPRRIFRRGWDWPSSNCPWRIRRSCRKVCRFYRGWLVENPQEGASPAALTGKCKEKSRTAARATSAKNPINKRRRFTFTFHPSVALSRNNESSANNQREFNRRRK